jgi:hypothetical protein
MKPTAEITRISRYTSEEIGMFTNSATIEHSEGDIMAPEDESQTTHLRAVRLLDPWIAGDRRRLDYEMRQWSEGGFELDGDDGRAGLLFCLVQQMMDEPDLFAPRSEKLHLGVWVDLLMHLAHPELSGTKA